MVDLLLLRPLADGNGVNRQLVLLRRTAERMYGELFSMEIIKMMPIIDWKLQASISLHSNHPFC